MRRRLFSAARWCRGPKARRRPQRATRRRLCVCTPTSDSSLRSRRSKSSTADTRVLLPDTVSHEDARVQPEPSRPLGRRVDAAARPIDGRDRGRLHQPQRAPAMPASAEYLRDPAALGVAAALSGAGPAVIALTTRQELPAEILEFGAANGFTVREMPIGEGVRWTSDVAAHPIEAIDTRACPARFLLPVRMRDILGAVQQSQLLPAPTVGRSPNSFGDDGSTSSCEQFAITVSPQTVGHRQPADSLTADLTPRMTKPAGERKDIRDRYGPRRGW